MPEKVNDKTVFTLLEVAQSIQKTLGGRYSSAFWVKAEMNKLNFYRHSGHCYPDLVEKAGEKIIAQMRSILWKEDYISINNKFLQVLKEPLKDGIKILFLATISFEPVHGLSLKMIDIDPAYTLGDLEKEKQETIQRLRDEGIFNRNKTLGMPLLPRRIAVISVQTSKGYADFLKVTEANAWGYKFFHLLFPSLLQGEKAIASIIGQLNNIRKVMHHFDVVAVIRGGGADVGLSCYNNYRLAREIALFPIPVVTGIGHATNETVVEMIAFENAITPTRLAEYFLQRFHDFSVPVQRAQEKITDRSRRLLREERTKFTSSVKLFRSVTKNILIKNHNAVREQVQSVFQQSHFLFKHEKEYLVSARATMKKSAGGLLLSRTQLIHLSKEKLSGGSKLILKDAGAGLSSMEKNVHNLSPENVLKRGYSITLLDGRAVRSPDQVRAGDILQTVLSEGTLSSIVPSPGNTVQP